MLDQDRHQEWDWDYQEQKWYHRLCDVYAADDKCIMCQTETPDSFTWQDVLDWVESKGFDQDEYFSLTGIYGKDFDESQKLRYTFLNSQVFGDRSSCRVWNISCYWVVGGSEGYYVHVDQVLSSRDCSIHDYEHSKDQIYHSQRGLVGKFWSANRAAAVGNAITKYIYSQQ
jgi:hypothetical protein